VWSRRAGALGLLVLVTCACAWIRDRHAPVVSAEEALLTRRVEGLRKLLARGAAGPLVDVQQVLMVVHQDVVRDLVTAATPFEQTILGRYRVRVNAATTEFADGFALVRLEGSAQLVDPPVWGDVVVLGGLEVVGLDESGLLRCQIRILAVEATGANVAGLDRPVRQLIDAFGRDALDALISVVDVPVKVENRVVIPGVNHRRVRIPAAEIPLQARVVEVQVFEERLWVGLAAATGGASPRPGASS
jgi:hypothetical protein